MNRLLRRVPGRYRDQVPPEIPELWREPARLRVLLASVVVFIVIPLALGAASRIALLRIKGREWFERRFLPAFGLRGGSLGRTGRGWGFAWPG